MRTPAWILLAILLTATACFGAGRIKGRVVDNLTNQPLVGANVLVAGTSFGAVAGVDGFYIILEVPAGVYKLTVRYVGYTPVTVEDLRVYNDFTTERDLSLTQEAVPMQPVVVTAERPLVNRTATNAVRIATSDQIDNLPVRTVNEILSLMPGVNYQNGNIYIRGGRVDEVGYYLEGVSVTEPQYGGRGITIAPQALEEISVQSAGYEAEYGRANAGIVQHQLKTGGDQFKASVEYVTDNILAARKSSWAQGKQRLGTTWYGYNEFTASTSTPLLFPQVKFFGLFHYLYEADRHPQPYPGSTIGLVVDPSMGDSVNFDYPPGIRLANSNQVYSGTGTLTFDLHPLHLRFSGSYTGTRYFIGAGPGDDRSRTPEDDVRDGFGALKAIYFFTPGIFTEVTAGWFGFSRVELDPYLRDNFWGYGDSLANAQAGIVWERRPGDAGGRYNPPPWKIVYGNGFWAPTQPVSQYLKMRRSNLSLNGAFSVQVGEHHTIKTGGDYQRYTIRTYQVWDPNVLAGVIATNDALPAGHPSKMSLQQIMIQSIGVNNYGYDVLGSLYNGNDFLGPRHPVFASGYIQDRMEFSDLVLNLGLRYDYINTAGYAPIDPSRPELTFDFSTHEVKPGGLRRTTPFRSFSPRLGISYPISDATVFHVQYAKLVQQSELRDINVGLYSGVFYSLTPTPVGFDLRPARTTQYEIGFTQQLGEFASFDVTGYYKDITDQIMTHPVVVDRRSPYGSYPAFVNGDFATTKGLEFIFTMRRYKRLLLSASLGFQDARGSGSFPNSNVAIIAAGTDTVFTPYYISPLSYLNVVRGNLSLDYRFGKDDGGPVLREFGASLLLTFNSGHPYTRISTDSYNFFSRAPGPAEPLNASTTPWVYQVDLRLDKTFHFGEALAGTLSLYVINLLDTRNVLNVWARTGSAEDNGYLSNPELSGPMIKKYGSQYADVYRLISLSYAKPSAATNIDDPYFYGLPRQVRLGFRFEY